MSATTYLIWSGHLSKQVTSKPASHICQLHVCVFASPVPDQVPFQHHPLLADVVQVALDVVDLLRAGLLTMGHVNHTLIHFPVVPSHTGQY